MSYYELEGAVRGLWNRAQHYARPILSAVALSLMPSAPQAYSSPGAPVPYAMRAQQAASKEPIPDAAKQKESEKTIREIYKQDYALSSPVSQQSLCAKLLRSGMEIKEPSADKFVLLREARVIALRNGLAEPAYRAIDTTADVFAIDAKKERADALKALSAQTSPENHRSLAQVCLQLARNYVPTDDYEEAAKYVSQADASAKRAQDVSLTLAVQDYGKVLAETKREYGKAKAAILKLEKDPDDEAANVDAGKYLCFFKGDWTRGLLMLSRSSNAALKKLANDDLNDASEASGKMALGDNWWAYADKDKTLKDKARERALNWYKQAWTGLDGLQKDKARAKFREVYTPLNKKDIKWTPADWNLGKTMSLDSRAFTGQAALRIDAGDAKAESLWTPRKTPVREGAQYRLSAWMLTDDTSGGTILELRFFTDATKFVAENIPIPADQPWWTYEEKIVNVPKDAKEMTILVWPKHTKGYALLDNISVKDHDTGIEYAVNGGFEQKK